MPFPVIPSPTIAIETAIANTITANVSGSPYNVYTGIGNEDKEAPAVIVYCKQAPEVAFNSRCYGFDVDLIVKEMAGDNTPSDLSSFAGNVFSLFANSLTGSANINAANVNQGVSVWQVQMTDYQNAHNGDAFVNQLTIKVIGALVPIS